MKAYFKLCSAIMPMALAAVAMTILATQPIGAAGLWYVAPGGDDGDLCTSPGTACGSINGALSKPGFVISDTILVASGTYTGTGSEVVLLDKNVTLSGGWDAGFTTQSGASTIDGERSRGDITVNGGVTAIVIRFNVQDGSRPAYHGSGGGIINSGTLTLINSNVGSNTTSGWGGGIINYGPLTLDNSTVNGNTASWHGGGIYNDGGAVTMNNSAVSGNTASTIGGGIINDGTVALTSSTVSGNATGLYDGGGIGNSGTLTLTNSTVSGNTANRDGGGIHRSSGTVTLQNTILANNTAGSAPDCSGDLGTVGYNLIGDTSDCTFIPTTGDLINIDPGLGPLQGSPGYHPLLLGSPAMDAGNCSGTISDQRGKSRPVDLPAIPNADDGCDIGAYEAQPLAFSTKTVNQFTALPGDPLTYTIALNNGGATNINNVCVTDTLPIFLTYIDDSLTATNGGYGYNSDVITWTGSVSSSGVVTITFGATVNQTAPLGYIVNSAVISGGGEIITRTATVNVIQPVEGAAISAPTTGLIHVDYPFIATVSPITATLPITYVWLATGQSPVTNTGGGLSNKVTFIWSAPGTQTITVTATNVGDMVTGTTTVYVGDQICLTKHTGNPILSVGPDGSWDDEAAWEPTVLKVGGTYKMWYFGYDGATSRIGYATSPDGLSWTKHGSYVLWPSQAWEGSRVIAPSVISDTAGGLYKMWYTGIDSNGVSRIGYATSPDGVTWTKYGGNPVLDVGSSGSWDDADVRSPAVFKVGTTYHMWYTGYDGVTDRIGHTTSSNGINWTRDSTNPVLDIGQSGAWDWLHVYGPSVVKVGEAYKLWYSGGTLPEAWQTGYALSPNGSDWIKGEMLIPEGGPGTFDSNSADYPSVIVDGAQFKIWYSGLDDNYTYNIGYATAEVCSAAAPLDNFTYLPIVMKSFNPQYPCPAYYTDDFSDPGSGWPIYEDGDVRYGYTGSQYQIWAKNDTYGLRIPPGAKATDFTAAVTARRASGSYGTYGIFFGLNEDWSQLYQVHIDANYYSIWRRDSGGWTALRDWTSSGYINTGTGWNRLKVIREGSSISVYVNNHHLATVTDGSYTGLRRIGLLAYPPGGGSLDARFDNFALYPASCGVDTAGVGFEMGEPEVNKEPLPPELDRAP